MIVLEMSKDDKAKYMKIINENINTESKIHRNELETFLGKQFSEKEWKEIK